MACITELRSENIISISRRSTAAYNGCSLTSNFAAVSPVFAADDRSIDPHCKEVFKEAAGSEVLGFYFFTIACPLKLPSAIYIFCYEELQLGH